MVDFTKCVNDSTLGPYSFKVFVDAAWTQEHLDTANVFVGRRPTIHIGSANLKRPRKQNIPNGQSRMTQKKQLVHMTLGHEVKDENEKEVEGHSEVGPVRTLRSSTQGGNRKNRKPY